jgi:hypothetical protein
MLLHILKFCKLADLRLAALSNISVNDNNKPTGELQYKINYKCKTFYSIDLISFNNIVN